MKSNNLTNLRTPSPKSPSTSKRSDKELHTEWESMSQLDDLETDSVNLLKDRCSERLINEGIFNSWDKKLNNHSQPNSRGITPDSVNGIKLGHLLGISPNLNNCPSPLTSALSLNYPPTPSSGPLSLPNDTEVFDTLAKFMTWFSQQEEDLTQGQELAHKEYKNQLLNYEKDYENLNESIQLNQAQMNLIQQEYTQFKQLTHSIMKSSKSYIEIQTKLSQKQQLIEQKLKFFNELSSIQKFLNQPGIHIIHRQEFISVLSKCDHCIQYLRNFYFYLDSAIYELKFRQSLIKGLSLIPLGLNEILKKVTDNCLLEKNELNDLTPPLLTKLVYNPYHPITLQYRHLIEEIETRTTNESEHQHILLDCQSILIQNRRRIIDFIYYKFLTKYSTNLNNEELIHWLNDSITKLEFLINEENLLYYKFFTNSSTFLEDHCDLIYRQFLTPLPNIFKSIQSDAILTSIQTSIIDPLQLKFQDQNWTKSQQLLNQLIQLLNNKLTSN